MPVARTGIKRGSGGMMKARGTGSEARGPEGDNQRCGLFMRGWTMGGAVDRIKGGPRTVCSMVGSGVAVQKKPISVLIIPRPPTPTHIRSGWRSCCPWGHGSRHLTGPGCPGSSFHFLPCSSPTASRTWYLPGTVSRADLGGQFLGRAEELGYPKGKPP